MTLLKQQEVIDLLIMGLLASTGCEMLEKMIFTNINTLARPTHGGIIGYRLVFCMESLEKKHYLLDYSHGHDIII